MFCFGSTCSPNRLLFLKPNYSQLPANLEATASCQLLWTRLRSTGGLGPVVASELGGQTAQGASGQSSEIPARTQQKSAGCMFSDAVLPKTASKLPACPSPISQGDTYHLAHCSRGVADRMGERWAVVCEGSACGLHAIRPGMLFIPYKP